VRALTTYPYKLRQTIFSHPGVHVHPVSPDYAYVLSKFSVARRRPRTYWWWAMPRYKYTLQVR